MNSLLSEDRRPSFEPPRTSNDASRGWKPGENVPKYPYSVPHKEPVVQPLPSGSQRGSGEVVDERLHDRRDRTEYPKQDPRENLTSELP